MAEGDTCHKVAMSLMMWQSVDSDSDIVTMVWHDDMACRHGKTKEKSNDATWQPSGRDG